MKQDVIMLFVCARFYVRLSLARGCSWPTEKSVFHSFLLQTEFEGLWEGAMRVGPFVNAP